MNKLKVLVVDDHPIYCQGLSDILKTVDEVDKVTVKSNGKEAIDYLSLELVDLVFLDLFMPVMDGTEAAIQIIKDYPSVKIIILTSTDSRKHIAELLKIGVQGYLLKGADKEELINAMKSVMNDVVYLNAVVNKIYQDFLLEQGNNKFVKKEQVELTKREVEVLQQICLQRTANEIAEILFLAPSTINNHRYNISIKTGISNSVGLAMFAVQHGYFDPKRK